MTGQKIFFVVVMVLLACMVWKYSWKVQLMYNSMGTSMYTPDSFTTDVGRSDKLAEKFAAGKRIAGEKSIIIAGLLRNSVGSIGSIRRKVERIGSAFKSYKVLIVENNSTDGTREELLKWAAVNKSVVILGCGVNAPSCSIKGAAAKATEGHSVYRSRIQKMVDLRNVYLDYIKNTPTLRNFDYTAVWDLDTVGMAYLDGIFDTIYQLSTGEHADKSAVCAHGVYRWLGVLPIYYDTYAHLDNDGEFHIDNKLNHDINTGLKVGLGHMRGQPLVPVQSCFSGFTIYRTNDLLPDTTRYTMTPEESTNLECEHVRLHQSLPGKMAMNPSMINLVLLNE